MFWTELDSKYSFFYINKQIISSVYLYIYNILIKQHAKMLGIYFLFIVKTKKKIIFTFMKSLRLHLSRMMTELLSLLLRRQYSMLCWSTLRSSGQKGSQQFKNMCTKEKLDLIQRGGKQQRRKR